MPIPLFDADGKWTWTCTKDGNFTVRSAYGMLMQEALSGRATSSAGHEGSDWGVVWNASVPPKVKHFAWRAIHGGLAVREQLGVHGMEVDQRCAMCGEHDETVMHILGSCEEVKKVWHFSPLRLDVSMTDTVTFREWCVSLRSRYKKMEWWSIFWSLSWGLWLRRNGWVFEGKKRNVEELIHKVVGMVEEYEKANEGGSFDGSHTHLNNKWTATVGKSYKINSDGAIFKGKGVGCGGVTRDSSRNVVVATSLFLPGVFEVEVVEAMDMRHALKVSKEAGFDVLVLETDNLSVYNKLKKGSSESSLLGSILRDIHILASSCRQVSFSFVKREGNGVAHSLAKLSCTFEGLRVWLEEYPPEVVGCVFADISAALS